MNEVSNLGLSGGVILGVIIVAGFTAFIAAPTVATRTIEFSAWPQICEKSIRQSIEQSRPVSPRVGDINCNAINAWEQKGFRELCDAFGNFSKVFPFMELALEPQRRLAEQQQRRLDKLASKAGDQCSCASEIVASDIKSWSIYTATGRLITPLKVKNLNSSLVTALNSPRCSFAGSVK